MQIACCFRKIRGHAAIAIFFAALSMFATVGVWPVNSSLGANGSVSYTYDAVGRMTSATYDSCLYVSYAYDLNGNRISETSLVLGSGGTALWGCFNWNAKNWVDSCSVLAGGGAAIWGCFNWNAKNWEAS